MKIPNLFKKSLWVILSQGTGMVASYLFTLFLTNMYGSYSFGLYSMVFASIVVVIVLCKMGTDLALVKLLSSKNISNKDTNEYYSILVNVIMIVSSLSILSSFLIFINSKLIAEKFFFNSDLDAYIKLFSFSIFPVVCSEIIGEYFRSKNKSFIHSIFKFSGHSVFLLFTGIIFYTTGLEIINISIFYVYSSFLLLLLAVVLFVLNLDRKYFFNNFSFNPIVVKTIMFIGLPVLFSNISSIMINWTSYYILNIYSNPVDISKLRILIRVSMLGMIILTSINSVIAPKLATQFNLNNIEGLKIETQKATILITLLSIPIYLILLLIGPYLMGLFGKEFLGMGALLLIVIIGKVIDSLTGPVSILLNMTGYQNHVTIIYLFGLVFTIVFGVILTKLYGILGMVIVICLTTIISNILFMIYVKKIFGFYSIPSIKDIQLLFQKNTQNPFLK